MNYSGQANCLLESVLETAYPQRHFADVQIACSEAAMQ
jgi:hypothetical protein